MKAIVLAGGQGTRLAPYTTVLPKPLMPIGDMPILDIVLRQLAAAGFDQITLAVGYLAELLMAYCGDGSRYGIELTYSREETPLGTAGPIALVSGMDGTFLVMNGDLLTTIDYGAMLEFHASRENIATVATFAREVVIDLGVIEAVDDRVVDYREKPTLSYAASAGIYLFEPAILEYIPRGERFDLPQLVLKLLDRGLTVGRFAATGEWLDIGRHDDYEEALRAFELRRHEYLPPVDGES
jgi:NDP-sugar pyrophosphorylase family protein